MSLKKSNKLLMAALLLSLGAAANTYAQQFSESEGVVRITDGKRDANGRSSGGIQQTASSQVMSAGTVLNGAAYPSGFRGGCPSGNCDSGNCPSGDCQYGNCPGGGYGRGNCYGRRGGHACPFGEHYCKHSPDYGYSPPAKYPLQRRGVEYSYYYPSKWYGAGGENFQYPQAPMVYQPTDTTQLGFYYQHVPFWQPQPDRLPARPIPAQWHIVAPPVSASRFCGPNGCYAGNPYSNAGYSGHGIGQRHWRFGGRQNHGYPMQDMYYTDDCQQGNSPLVPTPAPTAVPQSSANAGEEPQRIEPTPVPTVVSPTSLETPPLSTVPAIPGATTQKTRTNRSNSTGSKLAMGN